MDRIQEIEERIKLNVGNGLQEDALYLLAENKRLRLALEDIVDYQLRWSDSPITEVKKIAKEAIKEDRKKNGVE